MDICQIVFTNLSILGFDPHAMERKWRIPFNKEMFNLPNKKGFEAVIYFIFEKFNATKCREQFRDCWPVTDKKEEQEFRKVVSSWLLELSKEPDAHFPRIVSSLFLSPGGKKLYFLLFAFTRYVMHKLITQDYGCRQREFLHHPVLTSQNQCVGGVMQLAIQRQAVQYRRNYLALAQQVVAVEEQWKAAAKGEVHVYRGLTSQIRDLERQVKMELQKSLEQGHISPSSSGKGRNKVAEYDNNVQSIKRAQRVQKVRDQWRTMDEMHRNKAPEREVVESILEGTLDNYRIHGSQLNPQIPELLLRECEKEIQRRGVENIYEGGKLNLISLLHLWNLSLHLYIEKIHQAGLPNFEEANPILTTQQQTSHAYLTNLQALRIKLEKETICELKESVEMRKKELDELVLSSKSPKSVRSTSLGFGLMPPTPPVSFEPSKGQTPTNMAYGVNSSDKDAQGSTPEAAMLLMTSIKKRVASQSGGPLVQGSPVYAPRVDTSTKQSPGMLGGIASPLGEGSEVVKKGSKQVTKRKTAPAKQKQQLYRPQGPSKVKSVSSSSSHVIKETPSGTQLVKHSKVKGKRAKQELTEQVSVSSTASYQKGRYQPQRTSTPPLGGAPVGGEIQLDSSVLSSIPRSPPPEEEDALADRLVDELLSEDSPREMLGQDQPSPDEHHSAKDAFKSKDKLHRTPEKSTWQELLENSYGPLSSTRLDGGTSKTIERGDRDKVVTRLVLSPQHSDESSKTPQASLHSSSRQETYGAERGSTEYSKQCTPQRATNTVHKQQTPTPHSSISTSLPQHQAPSMSTTPPQHQASHHTSQSAKQRHSQSSSHSSQKTPGQYRSKALEEDPYGESTLKFNSFTPNLSGVGPISEASSLNWADIQQKLSFGTDVTESYRHLSESATPTLPTRRGSNRENKLHQPGQIQSTSNSKSLSSSSGSSGGVSIRKKSEREEPLITFDTPSEIDPTPSHLSCDDGPVKVIDVLTMTPKKEGTEYNLGIFDLNLIEGLERLSASGHRSSIDHQRLSESLNTTLTEPGQHQHNNQASDSDEAVQNHVKWKDLEQEIRNADQNLHESQLTSLTSELEDDTIKVIHFQDGSFNEFEDKSPVKHPGSKKPSKHDTSQHSDTDNSERNSARDDKDTEDVIKTTSLESHSSRATSDWNPQPSATNNTDSLIARYNKIRSAQGGINNNNNSELAQMHNSQQKTIQASHMLSEEKDLQQPQAIKSMGNDNNCDEARLGGLSPAGRSQFPPPHSPSPHPSPYINRLGQQTIDFRPDTSITQGLKPFSPSTSKSHKLQQPSQGNNSRSNNSTHKFTLDFDESFEGDNGSELEEGGGGSVLSSLGDLLGADPITQAAAAQRPFNMWSPGARGSGGMGASNRNTQRGGVPLDLFSEEEMGILQSSPMLHMSPHSPPTVPHHHLSHTTPRLPQKQQQVPPVFPDIFGEDESLLVPASP